MEGKDFMRLIIIFIIASAFAGCASISHDDRGADRIAKVCVYNVLTRWMSSGANSTGVQGDVKKAADAVAAANLYSGVCSETVDTINEAL